MSMTGITVGCFRKTLYVMSVVLLLNGVQPASAAPVTFFSENMDSDPGWSTESQWAFGVPLGGGSHDLDPTAGYTGANVYGYNLAGDYANNIPERYLTTTALDCSGYENVTLTFRRWLGVERAEYDHAKIQVSANGSTWTDVWVHHGSEISDSAWQEVSYDIAAVADRQATVYIRWGMGSSDDMVTYPGWNIDDVSLSGVAIESFAVSPSDPFVSIGRETGPFSPASRNYIIRNTGATPMNWTATVSVDWLSFTATNGTLAAGTSTNGTLAFSTAANSLPGGMYTGAVLIANSDTGQYVKRYVHLEVQEGTIVLWTFDSDPGWDTEGEWEFGVPTTGGEGGPSSGATGSNVYATVLDDYYSNDQPLSFVTTPPIDCSDYANVRLVFQRYIYVRREDDARIMIKNSEITYDNLWRKGDVSLSRHLWQEISYDISQFADYKEGVQIRWGLGSDSWGQGCGWYIDDVKLVGDFMDDLQITPDDTHTSSGIVGGPFEDVSKTYSLSNIDSDTVEWELSASADWLSLSATNGTIPTGAGPDVVTATLNSAADALNEGVYTNTLTFYNAPTDITQTREFILTVRATPRLAVAPASISVTIYDGGTKSVDLVVSNLPYGTKDMEFSVSSFNGSAPEESSAMSSGPEMMSAPTGQSSSRLTMAAAAVEEPDSGRDFTILSADAKYTPESLIVRFKGGAREAARASLVRTLGGDRVKHRFRIVPNLCEVELPPGLNMQEALERFNASPDVLYAEPNYQIRELDTIPDDTRFSEQWGLHNTGQTGGTPDADIDAPAMWDFSQGTRDVVVGIVDTGVDYNHPDLSANMWTNSGEIPGNGIDDDSNGFVDDVYGYDFANNDGDPWDDRSHGTHCAGIAAAVGDNGAGVAGVAWRTKIMALKFLNSSGGGNTADAVRAVEYATLMGADVLNNSWGEWTFSQSLHDAIAAANAAGMLFVAAAGNDNSDNDPWDQYPASYDVPNVISVMSTDHNDDRSSFSNWGLTSVDIGAPGSDILSTIPGGGYALKSGTSMATPMVVGACAVLLALDPALSVADVKNALFSSVDPTLPDLCVSGGRLNLRQAMNYLSVPWITMTPESGDGVSPGESSIVEVEMDAAGMDLGTYYARLRVSCNDLLLPSTNIPVTLIVSDTPPVPNTTNAIPYAESFESYTPGFELPGPPDGTNGWYAATPDAASVSTNAAMIAALTGTYTGGFPISTNHTQVLRTTEPITNAIDSGSANLVKFDGILSLKPGISPELPSGEQTALHVNSDGAITILHADTDNGTTFTNEWLALTNGPAISSNEWMRVTLLMNYTDNMFQLRLNDGLPLSDSKGWNAAGGTQPGTWFYMADRTRSSLSHVSLSGETWLDDLVLTESVLPPAQASAPSPGEGATGVSIDADVSWTAGSGATARNVYGGTNVLLTASDLLTNGTTATTYDPGTLLYNTTYYWRIDESNEGGITEGSVWNFTTAPQMFALTLSAGSGGNVSPESGSYASGQTVEVTASPNTYYHFTQWSGDTGAITTGTANDAAVTVTLNSAVSLSAAFAADETTEGTPHEWMADAHPDWTNDFETIEADDFDEDGLTTGQEYESGTDPTNAASVFAGTIGGVEGDAVIHLPTIESDISGKVRRYGIKTAADLTGTWNWVPGYSNILGQGQTVIYTNTADGAAFIRGHVWLE